MSALLIDDQSFFFFNCPICFLTLAGRRLDLQPPTVEVDLTAEQRSLSHGQ